MRDGRHAKPDKPTIVEHRPERGNNEADPRETAPEQSRDDRAPVPAAAEGVYALLPVQIAKPESLLMYEPIVGNQNAGDGAQSTGVSDQPRENVPGRIGEES